VTDVTDDRYLVTGALGCIGGVDGALSSGVFA